MVGLARHQRNSWTFVSTSIIAEDMHSRRNIGLPNVPLINLVYSYAVNLDVPLGHAVFNRSWHAVAKDYLARSRLLVRIRASCGRLGKGARCQNHSRHNRQNGCGNKMCTHGFSSPPLRRNSGTFPHANCGIETLSYLSSQSTCYPFQPVRNEQGARSLTLGADCRRRGLAFTRPLPGCNDPVTGQRSCLTGLGEPKGEGGQTLSVAKQRRADALACGRSVCYK